MFPGKPHRHRVSLFSLADDRLAELGDGRLEVDFYLKVFRRTEDDREMARVPLNNPPHIVHGGNRIAISSRQRTDDRLNVRLRHVFPRFVYEPSDGRRSAFESPDFAYSLVGETTGEPIEGDFASRHYGNSTGVSAGESTLRFRIPEDFDETGAMLVIRERRLEQVGSHFHSGEFNLPNGGSASDPGIRLDWE